MKDIFRKIRQKHWKSGYQKYNNFANCLAKLKLNISQSIKIFT